MSNRYFQISKHDRVVTVNGVQFKFIKAGRNMASGGFNGLIEVEAGEQADMLAAAASDFGAWEITETAAIVEIQKKSLSLNRVLHKPALNPESAKAAEVKGPEPEGVESIDDLMSEPAEPAVEEPAVEEPETDEVKPEPTPEPTPEPVAPKPVKPPVKRRTRKARKNSKK